MSAVALTLAWLAPFSAIDIGAALKLPGKLTMAKNVGVTEGKNKKPLIYHRPI